MRDDGDGVREPEDLFDELFHQACQESLGAGQGAELYERRGASLEIAEDEQGERLVETKEHGFALRLFRAGRVAFTAATPEGAAQLLPRAKVLLPRARSRRGVRAAAGQPSEPRPAAAAEPPIAAAARELATTFRTALAAAGKRAVMLRDLSVTVGSRSERVATASGRDVAWDSAAATLVATVVGRSADGRFLTRVVGSAPSPEELPAVRLAHHAVDRALLPLSGKAVDPGRTDLLLDPLVAAHLVARLAPLFFGDATDGLLGRRTRDGQDAVASPAVSLVDDGLAAGGAVRVAFDAEGTPKTRTMVVERGVTTGRLTDVASAARHEEASSGNARRRAWSEPPSVAVTNFFVDARGGMAPLELLRNVTRGLYAVALVERPEVDLVADRFRLVTAGYVVERGQAAERFSEAVVSGRLSQLLRGIHATGDDLKFVAGPGGGAGSPTLFIPRWKST